MARLDQDPVLIERIVEYIVKDVGSKPKGKIPVIHTIMCASKAARGAVKEALSGGVGLIVEVPVEHWQSDRFPKDLQINGLEITNDPEALSSTASLGDVLNPFDLSNVGWIRIGDFGIYRRIKVSADDIAKIAAICPSAKHLHFRRAVEFEPSALASCSLFPNLETVSTEVQCGYSTRQDYSERTVDELAHLSESLPNVEQSLTWDLQNYIRSTSYLKDMFERAAAVKNLRKLSLIIENIGDREAAAVAMASPSFHELTDFTMRIPPYVNGLGNKEHIGDFLDPLTAMKKLRILQLPANCVMSGTDLASLVTALPVLQSLIIGGLTWSDKDQSSTWPVGSRLQLTVLCDDTNIAPLLLLPLENVALIKMAHCIQGYTHDNPVRYTIPCMALGAETPTKIYSFCEKVDIDIYGGGVPVPTVHLVGAGALDVQLVSNVRDAVTYFLQTKLKVLNWMIDDER